MKKRAFGTILFLMCMLLFMPVAHAEEMKVSVTATPTELSDTGTVAFTFVVSNYSDYELGNITISYLGTPHEILKNQTIPPNGEARDIILDLHVSESQLGSPIPFIIAGIRNGEPITQDIQITIARASDPVITVLRSASANSVRQGENISLTYALKNQTKFDMTDITLIDENISDNPILKQEMLRAGDTFSLDRTYTMGTESVVSTPFVTYSVNGKTKTFSAIEPLTLTMLLIKLDLNIEMGTPTAAGVNFTLDIKNSGNQTIEGINITDERNNSVNSAPFSLKTGESTTHSFQVVPVMTEPLRNVKFILTGTDSMGMPYKLESTKAYEVYPFVDDTQIQVSVRAETVTPWTSESGKVVARIIVTNHSLVELKNVAVAESTLGVIKSFDMLSTGDTSFDQEILLGAPRNLQFTIKGNDPTGTTRELGNCMLPVAYDAAGSPAPDASPEPTNDNNMGMFNFMSSTISKILITLGMLMVVAFIVLITLSVMERSRSGHIRFDDRDDEDDLDELFDSPAHPYEIPKNMAAEEASYTRRMHETTMRHENGYSTPPRPKPIPLPSPEDMPHPTVPIEYEDTYEGQRAYAPSFGSRVNDVQLPHNAQQWESAAPPMLPQQTKNAVPPADYTSSVQPKTTVTQMDSSRIYEEYEEEESHLPIGSLRTPKIFEHKSQPAVQPQSRNAVRHVHADKPRNQD
ncbi:MAG: hypothetical protein RRZ24_03280 [Clostridia bacterium]